MTWGPAALALVLLHSWNLKCPTGMLTAVGLCALGGGVGSPSPFSAPGGNRTKRMHTLASPPSLSSRGSEASPTPFSPRSLCPARPSPTLPQPRLLWDRALGHWTLCTVTAAPRLAGDECDPGIRLGVTSSCTPVGQAPCDRQGSRGPRDGEGQAQGYPSPDWDQVSRLHHCNYNPISLWGLFQVGDMFHVLPSSSPSPRLLQ